MTVALVTRGMVCIKQVVLEGRPVVTQVEEAKPAVMKVVTTPTSDDLKPVIIKIEEQ